MDWMHSAVCKRFGAEYQPSARNLMIVVAVATLGQQPLNGLRHPQSGNISGWYVWAGAGDCPSDVDLFEVFHIDHLDETLPEIIPYLGLAPGWRFQIAPGHEDVWFDPQLLDVS